MDDRGARLVVLLLGDPHLLEGGERREDGASRRSARGPRLSRLSLAGGDNTGHLRDFTAQRAAV